MQVFVHHTHLFNSYICIDPSMWWENQNLLKETKSALEIGVLKEQHFI
jgi:predicted alpha/beta superfamily hydrolase